MLRNLTFMTKRGRIQIPENKARTEGRAIEAASVPEELIYPLGMHIGAPAEAVVETGDHVKRGQLIAEAGGFVSANIYASVSGEVVAVEDRPTDKGSAKCIVIKNDGKDEMAEPFEIVGADADAESIIKAVRNAGIVGMGGASFPTSVKLSPPKGKTIDTLIINGAECEPYSTSDHLVMKEYMGELLEATKITAGLYPQLRNIYFVVENNKQDVIKKLREITKEDSRITVRSFRALYPTGSEKVLIQKLTGREVAPGGLPADVHCILLNVSSLLAVRRAVVLGQPLMDRVVSVSGDAVKDAKNLMVRIGTPVASLIADCGGLRSEANKILLGGPMMGRAVADPGIPITKAVTAVTVLSPDDTRLDPRTPCIMCAECLHVCPVNLQPILISEAYEQGRIEDAKKLGANDCIECGNCSYICPAKISLLDNIRLAKAAIKAMEEK